MKERIKKIFKELIEEGKKGVVNFETLNNYDKAYPCVFYIDRDNVINKKGNKNPIIKIKDDKRFFDLIEEYLKHARPYFDNDREDYCLSREGYDKFLIYMLFVNCDNYGLSHFNEYLAKRVEMIKNIQPKESYYLDEIQGYDLVISITKSHSKLEAPNIFYPIFTNDADERFLMPKITYGFYDKKTAYIGAIQRTKSVQKNKISKSLDRYFRKLNKDVDMEEIEGNVSTNALASLTIFISYLKYKGIEKIIVPSFMPIRSQVERRLVEWRGQVGKLNLEEQKQAKKDLDRNQYNMTNKLMYLMIRYGIHFNQSDVYFDEDRQEMVINLKNQKEKNDNIIYDLDKKCFDGFMDYEKEN